MAKFILETGYMSRLIIHQMDNMGLIGHNKQFLWAGVGALCSMHDLTLLQSCPIFNAFKQGKC